MTNNRSSIKRRIQQMVLQISIAALLLTSAVGIVTMLNIRRVSEKALLTQMENGMGDITRNRAQRAELLLNVYSSYISRCVSYIESLYAGPQNFAKRPVLPPDTTKKGVYSMQRFPATKDVKLETIADELALLGNLEAIWHPMMEMDGDKITTVYVGTESGFLISYDKNADIAEFNEGETESYFDFFKQSWYLGAKKADRPFFTDLYPDSYGRGLMISCAAPFKKGGQFAGVVCMDILVTDLHKSIIDLSIGKGSFSFLVNKKGDIIASPHLKLDQTDFKNIHDDTTPASAVADRILSGNVGVAALPDQSVFYAFAPISVADWTLCIHIPKDFIFDPVHKINSHIQLAICLFLTAFVVIIIAVIMLARLYSRTITRPLLRLKHDVQLISKGNLDRRAEITTNDEIGDLATSFNNMAVSLDQYIKDLTTVTAEKERIGAELDVAKHIQSSMLPCIFPPYPDRKEFEIYATMQPAKEVGGDFYDFFMVDDAHLAVVMADVSGKGVPAALFMVIGKTLIKDHTEPGSDLGSVFSEVNNMLCESNSEGLFITAFEGVLDLKTGEFRFVNAGHEPPFIAHAGQPFDLHKIRPGFVLAGMEDVRYKSGSIQLDVGDKIFLYTDGVTEATDAANNLYGMDRLTAALNTVADRCPDDILPAIKKDIDEFVGSAPQFDDITMLCLEYKERMP
ncbi:MAG: SpoIIE family protein phosphatase [Lentisphaeria bacterium]|nr:SpoIIE family protein phosphatase [Lentisphaeria bacterium]